MNSKLIAENDVQLSCSFFNNCRNDSFSDRKESLKRIFVQTYVQPACTLPCLYSGRHRIVPVCCSRERSFVSPKQWSPDKTQDTQTGPSPHRTAPLWLSAQHPGASFQRGAETQQNGTKIQVERGIVSSYEKVTIDLLYSLRDDTAELCRVE